jgi:predicted nucleic acid-binding protein
MNLNKVCVDASVVVSWLFDEEYSHSADALRREWHDQGVQMLGPALFHVEVTSAIRQRVYFGQIQPEEGEEVFLIYLDIPIRIIDGQEIYRLAWQLAKEHNSPVCYDMQYLAVAELEDCELWTADSRLVNSLKGKNPRVRWIGESARST